MEPEANCFAMSESSVSNLSGFPWVVASAEFCGIFIRQWPILGTTSIGRAIHFVFFVISLSFVLIPAFLLFLLLCCACFSLSAYLLFRLLLFLLLYFSASVPFYFCFFFLQSCIFAALLLPAPLLLCFLSLLSSSVCFALFSPVCILLCFYASHSYSFGTVGFFAFLYFLGFCLDASLHSACSVSMQCSSLYLLFWSPLAFYMYNQYHIQPKALHLRIVIANSALLRSTPTDTLQPFSVYLFQ